MVKVCVWLYLVFFRLGFLMFILLVFLWKCFRDLVFGFFFIVLIIIEVVLFRGEGFFLDFGKKY